MANILIEISEPNKAPRTSIHPEQALGNFQRVFGSLLTDFYKVDENGNRINEPVKLTESPKVKAFRLMQESAKSMNILGWETMNESELLKAIQLINSSNQVAPVTKSGKAKTRKQNATKV